MSRPLYIFDLDGTLALVDHRRGILTDGGPDRWRRFFAACVHDRPNEPVVRTAQALSLMDADVWVFSGRSNEVWTQTRSWLERHVPLKREPRMLMRPEGDFTPDEVLKRGWLRAMSQADRARLVAVFDDRDKVVRMWREEGVACFQVAPGDF